MNKDNGVQKGTKWIPKKKVPQNRVDWPCTSPFAEDSSKHVAHILVEDANMNQIKEVGIY